MSEKRAGYQAVVTRFAPSPTGTLHVGGARTALFNWAFARHHSREGSGDPQRAGGPPSIGRFILRVEDTDVARSSAEAARGIFEDLRWLGLNWDHGPDPDADDLRDTVIGTPGTEAEPGEDRGPYFQSRRLDIYKKHLDRLIESGRAYKCYKTQDEIAAQKRHARAERRPEKYDPTESLNLTPGQIAAYEEEGRKPVFRLRMPDHHITFRDEVLGEVTVAADELEDFIIFKSDGSPTYHFASVVDDALMGVTHVIRGQEHLNNTPRHWALQEALGFEHPAYAHLPLIFNADGSKMSKRDKSKAARAAAQKWFDESGHDLEQLASAAQIDRDLLVEWLNRRNDDPGVADLVAGTIGVTLPEIDVRDFRASGYLPEVLRNYLALLGWNPGGDVEKFDTNFLIEHFSLDRVGRSNARFDREKLFRFNGDALAAMGAEQFRDRLRDYLLEFHHAEYASLCDDDERFAGFAAAYHGRARTLLEAAELGRFFVAPPAAYDEEAVSKHLAKNDGEGFAVLEEVGPLLAGASDWSAAGLESTLKQYAERKGLGMGKLAQPLRVAVTGSMVSPPIFDSLAILGQGETVERIDRCRAVREQA